MPTHKIIVTKTTIQQACVNVEAESQEEALEIADQIASHYDTQVNWLKAGSDLIYTETPTEEHNWLTNQNIQ